MSTLIEARLACEAFGAQGIERLRVKIAEVIKSRYPDALRAEVSDAALFIHDLATLSAAPPSGRLDTRRDFALRAVMCYLGYDPTRPEGQGFEPPISPFETVESELQLARYVILRAIDLMCYSGSEQKVAARMLSDILLDLRNKGHKEDTLGKRKIKRFESDMARARRLADLIANGYNKEV